MGSQGFRRLRPALPPWSWKPAETWHSAAFEASPGALQATSIGGPEVDVRHCRLGAGRLLKRSVPLGFAVAQHGFRGFAWGSTSYFSNRKSRHRGPILSRFWKYGKTKRKMKHLCGLFCTSYKISHHNMIEHSKMFFRLIYVFL